MHDPLDTRRPGPAPVPITAAPARLPSTPVELIRAAIARINGSFDDPELLKFGPLSESRIDDVLSILQHCTSAASREQVATGPDFTAVRDKRMSELTPSQQADAHELWLRENLGYMPAYHQEHYRFLLGRLDQARENPALLDILCQAHGWLKATLECKQFAWDWDQREMAESTLKDLAALLPAEPARGDVSRPRN